MRPDDLKQYLRGVLAFPVTPFKDDLSVDYDALQRNIDFMLSRGIRAIAVCGGTGELYSLSQDEITACYRAAVEVARGRAAVVAGVGFNGRIGAALAAAAEQARLPRPRASGCCRMPAMRRCCRRTWWHAWPKCPISLPSKMAREISASSRAFAIMWSTWRPAGWSGWPA